MHEDCPSALDGFRGAEGRRARRLLAFAAIVSWCAVVGAWTIATATIALLRSLLL